MNEEFIGRGWAFPVRTDATGGIALVTREREIEEAIRLVLGTAPGERPMRPEFGCRIHDYAFSAATAARLGDLGRVKSAPAGGSCGSRSRRQVTFDAKDPTVMYIDIRYSIRRTNDRRNLVFPFYVIPGGD
jgi:phage baseplate assembly protein W